MSTDRRESAAVARWKPGRRWYHPSLAFLVIRLSRFIMNTLNTLTIERLEVLHSLRERDGRGLLTFSNHVSLFDDPLLISNFNVTRYDDVRWVAADAINFFGSPFKAWLFTAGKAVPIARGSGLNQPGLAFVRDRLAEGAWVHIFPEGGRTRDPRALMTHPVKTGIGRLMAEAQPIALPFYHYGMHEVLPVGARLPRRGKSVRLVFGDPVDCSRAYIREVAPALEAGGAAGPPLWEALAERAYDALHRLETAVHPAAGAAGEGR